MSLRHLLLVVPAAASLVAGYALLGPGARRDLDGARLYTATSRASGRGEVHSARVTLARASITSEVPRAGRVTVTVGGTTTTVVVGDDGAAECVFDPPVALGERATITEGDRVLAVGALALPATSAPADDLDHVLELGEWGSSTGKLGVTARVPRGPLVPKLASELIVEIRDADGELVPAHLDVEAIGADCAACDAIPEHTASIRIPLVPTLDVVSLTLDARAPDGRKGHAYAEIPVRMGALFLGPVTDTTLTVSAPSRRNGAYLSFFRGGERVAGAYAALVEDDLGLSSATVPLPEPAAEQVVLTTDAEEAGTSTMWTLRRDDPSKKRVTAPRLAKTLDGFPDLRAAEARRIGWVHRILFLAVGALGLLEVVLLGIVARMTRRELTTHFEEASEGDDLVLRPAPPIQPLRSTAVVIVTVGLVVVLASAALVGLAFVRG